MKTYIKRQTALKRLANKTDIIEVLSPIERILDDANNGYNNYNNSYGDYANYGSPLYIDFWTGH